MEELKESIRQAYNAREKYVDTHCDFVGFLAYLEGWLEYDLPKENIIAEIDILKNKLKERKDEQ